MRLLDSEARLHLPGRLRTRGEIQLILQNRLRMVDLWKREPAVLRSRCRAHRGHRLGRSGTTLLHELLACDPDNRPPLLWELLHTVPYDDASGDLCDDEIRLMDEMVPAFTAMHENGGRLPTECIFAFAHQFSSDIFTGLYNVADYTVWRSGQDQAPIYDWHKRHLQTLQWVAERPTTRWVVKAPSHLSALPLLFSTYPDARVVITHRDPLASSARSRTSWRRCTTCTRTMSTTASWSSSWPWVSRCRWTTSPPSATPGPSPTTRSPTSSTGTWSQTRSARSSGSTPSWGLPVTPAFARPSTPTSPPATPAAPAGHDYSFADTGLDLATHRALVAPYQQRFGVPSEV